jgi:uncharacterized SAM-binding protein YcdF (DUF218 family)
MRNQRFIGQRKSIFMVLVLPFITCGIYSFVWLYQTTRELNEYTGDYRVSPGLAVVLTIITGGLYQIYWWYRMNEQLMQAQADTGYSVITDNKLLFILLAIFGLGIINVAILQSDLNLLWERAMYVEEEPKEVVYQTESHMSDEDDEWTDY